MSRPHQNLLRGLSSDERMKTKTKKSKNCQERRELNPLKTNEGSQSKNMDILLSIANSMKLLADRHSEQRFKAIDVKVIELIVTELTLTRRMEEYERDQNRAKVREMKSLIQKVVAKKNQVIAQSERINLLIRSGSPKNRKGIIAYEMSPPIFNNPVGLIQRRIEEDNRERVTFQAMKKKDQRLGRLFDFVDRLAERLKIGGDENGSLKGRINRIMETIEGMVGNEQEFRGKMKEMGQCNEKLKQELEALSSQNAELRYNIDSLTAELESCKQSVSLKTRLYSQLQQDFNLLAKEKLDAETTFSKVLSQSQRTKDRYMRTINNLKVRFSELLKEEVDELKNTQIMLGKQVEEFTLSHCESVNTIIYHYTKEMMALTAKKAELKKQVMELQREKSANEQERDRELDELRIEVKESQEKERRRRERLAVGQCFYEEFQGVKRGSKFVFEFLENFTRLPAEKMDECSQTYMKTNPLSINQIEGTTIIPKTQHISLQSKVFELVLLPSDKQFNELKTQTEPQALPYCEAATIDTHEFSLQTTLEHSSQEIQAIPSFNDISTNTLTQNLAIHHAFQLLATHLQNKEDAFTETEHASLLLNEGYSLVILPTKSETIQAETNTDLPTLSFSQPQPTFQPETPTQNLPQPPNDPFLSFLLEAQHCTILPEISILRQQLRLHRLQIDSLRSQLSSRPKQSEDPSVFQFHY